MKKKKRECADDCGIGVQAKMLAPVFAICRPFAASQSLIPTMQHFCVYGDQIMATDGIIGIIMKLPVALPEGTWPADLMSKLMALFSGDQIVKLVAVGDGQMSVEAGSYNVTFATYPAVEFPWVELPAEREIVTPDCIETLRKIRFCCSLDKTNKPVMSSIQFSDVGMGYATTGTRIAWRQSTQKKGTVLFAKGLVPGRLIDSIVGWGVPTEWTVDVQGRFWLFFSDPERAVFALCPTGEFPNVSGVIDRGMVDIQTAVGFYLDDSFAGIVRRVLLLSEGEVNAPIHMALDGLTVRLSATGSLKGCTGSVVERMSVKRIPPSKSSVSITVNGQFLLDLAERCTELFVLDGSLVGFAEDRTFGYLVALLHG